jgi:hypothetical protein
MHVIKNNYSSHTDNSNENPREKQKQDETQMAN